MRLSLFVNHQCTKYRRGYWECENCRLTDDDCRPKGQREPKVQQAELDTLLSGDQTSSEPSGFIFSLIIALFALTEGNQQSCWLLLNGCVPIPNMRAWKYAIWDCARHCTARSIVPVHWKLEYSQNGTLKCTPVFRRFLQSIASRLGVLVYPRMLCILLLPHFFFRMNLLYRTLVFATTKWQFNVRIQMT